MKRGFQVVVILLMVTMFYAVKSYAVQEPVPPTIEAIEVLTPVVEQGKTAKIKVTIKSGTTDTEEIKVLFGATNSSVSFIKWISEDSIKTNEYILEARLGEEVEMGVWHAAQATITDFSDGFTYYDTVGFGAESAPLEGVSFEVIEKKTSNGEPGPVDDEFKSLEDVRGVPLDKTFTLKFNMNIDVKTITEGNIYVLDVYGDKVPTIFIVDRGANPKTNKIIISPLNQYSSSSKYTLYLKNIKSDNGKVLKQNTKMNFYTK